MNDKCYFDRGKNYCVALKEKECDGCKFRKTKEEYLEGVENSRRILEEKGLKTLIVYGENGGILRAVNK